MSQTIPVSHSEKSQPPYHETQAPRATPSPGHSATTVQISSSSCLGRARGLLIWMGIGFVLSLVYLRGPDVARRVRETADALTPYSAPIAAETVTPRAGRKGADEAPSGQEQVAGFNGGNAGSSGDVRNTTSGGNMAEERGNVASGGEQEGKPAAPGPPADRAGDHAEDRGEGSKKEQEGVGPEGTPPAPGSPSPPSNGLGATAQKEQKKALDREALDREYDAQIQRLMKLSNDWSGTAALRKQIAQQGQRGAASKDSLKELDGEIDRMKALAQ